MSRKNGIHSVSIALVGSGGAGVMTAGTMLLKAAARAGWYGVMTRSLGPQIRGGESAALLRLADAPVESHGDGFDLLIAVDWHNFDRFAKEVRLSDDTLVLADLEAGDVPELVQESGAQLHDLPFAKLLEEEPKRRPNMLAVGAAAKILGIREAPIEEIVRDSLARKGEEVVASSLEAAKAGRDAGPDVGEKYRLPAAPNGGGGRWLISGNQATGLGALRGGVRFVAAYPITPATDILEWMAPKLKAAGGTLVQAEDELASLNMVIGASFGGVPALTATSGPGFALMVESLGLAVATEVPLVLVDVMRCGPSTGIATKSEQSDLNIAVYGLHGDAPHVVVAPNTIADCAETGQWAVQMAEYLQTPVVLLSDQALGQTTAVVPRAEDTGARSVRAVAAGAAAESPRYEITDSGISRMAIPGTAGGQYSADGLTHNERGNPSTAADDHRAQIEKRQSKLDGYDFGDRWADIEGDGELAVLSYGSSCAPIREALAHLKENGLDTRLIALRLIAPAQPEKMRAALAGVKRLLVIEQSHTGQLYRYMRAFYDLPGDVQVYNRPGPLPFTPGEICEQVEKWQ